MYIYICNGLFLQNDEYHSLASEEAIYRQLTSHDHLHVGYGWGNRPDFLLLSFCEVNGAPGDNGISVA